MKLKLLFPSSVLYVRAMLTLIILRYLHTKSIYFVLAYKQADLKSVIFMELPIGFGFGGDHPREWIIRLDANNYGPNNSGLTWFEKSRKVWRPE